MPPQTNYFPGNFREPAPTFYNFRRLFVRTVGASVVIGTNPPAYAWTLQSQQSAGNFTADPSGISGATNDYPLYMADEAADVPDGTICEAVDYTGGWLVGWPIEVPCEKGITFTDERIRCGDGVSELDTVTTPHTDFVLHQYQRTITAGGCYPSEGAWTEIFRIGCVSCFCGHGSGSASGSGSGSPGGCVTITVPCCPFPLPCVLCVQVTLAGALNGNYTATYSLLAQKWVVTIGACVVLFDCNARDNPSVFELICNNQEYDSSPTYDQCTPILAVFSGVDLSACGGGAAASLTFTTGPCGTGSGSGSGSVGNTACCPQSSISSQVCITFGGSLKPLGSQILTYGALSPTGWGIQLAQNCAVLGSGPGPIEIKCGNLIAGHFSLLAGLTAVASQEDTLSCSPFRLTYHGVLAAGTPCDGAWTAVVTDDLTACGGGPIDIIGTPCCDPVLLKTIYNAAFGGALLGMNNVALTWNPKTLAWEGLSAAPCGDLLVSLRCFPAPGGPQWRLSGATNPAHGPSLLYWSTVSSSSSCSPLILTFAPDVLHGPCVGNATCTVS